MFKACSECCAACCGGTQETPSVHRRRISYAKVNQSVVVRELCSMAFLPACARRVALELKNNKELTVPIAVRHHVIFMTCEIPAIPEIIDMYTISKHFSIVDVMDEMNLYITGIMKRMAVDGGDVISFQDGYLECIWPILEEENNFDNALDTALAIQQEYGSTQTKMGIMMTNKIALADGEVDLILVGSKRVLNVVAGDVMQVTRDCLFFPSKEVVVTAEYWENVVKKDRYRFKKYEENYIKVLSTTERIGPVDEEKLEEFYKRLKISAEELGEDVDKYLQPLHKNARTWQQIQILTTTSQVVFCAIRLKGCGGQNIQKLQQIVDIVDETVDEFQGILCNVVYKTDLTMCVVFGFPGFKHRDDAVRGILCAQKILKCLEEIGVQVSIGISAGMVFCGILGPNVRLLCCVLGMSCKLAFQLVEHFSDEKMVCGINAVFRSCRTLGEIFTPLNKKVKGIKISSTLFRVHTAEEKKKILRVKCVGRKKEKEMITSALSQLKGGMETLELLPLINITGKMGTGKTTVLSYSIQKGIELGYKITAIVKNSAFEEPNGNAWSIVKQVLGSCVALSETKILEMLGTSASSYPLHLLNKRINTTFAEPSITMGQDNSREMMVELIRKCAKDELVLIGLDSAEHTGTDSWLFLQCLLVDRIAVVIASFTEEFSSSVPFVRHLMKQQYLGVNLGPTEEGELGYLACHVLQVRAIHKGFLDFLQEQSDGNALKLQEILMLPPLQKHFCLVPYNNISPERLEQDFVMAEEEEADLDPYSTKVCDILYQENLSSIQIPKHLLDIVRDHTTGLNPEEQMLMRKCALFGESFGLRILETVCPEYSYEELYEKVKSLAAKNILTDACDHWEEDDSRPPDTFSGSRWSRRRLSLRGLPIDYCLHPLRFRSDFLKRCVLHAMAEGQRERMHLYIADLLVGDRARSCDACRRNARTKSNENNYELLKDYKIPKVDFRLCQCLNLHTDILIEAEYHLEKGKAPIYKRINILLDAAESGLEARNVAKVEELLNKCKLLKNWQDDEANTDDVGFDYVRVAIERLRAELKIDMGKRNDALRHLKQAMLFLNVVFPGDIKSRKYKRVRNKGQLGIEECRCLSLGCFILIALEKYDDAARVGKLHLKGLVQIDKGTCDVIEGKVLLLKAISKSQPNKKREIEVTKLINQIRQQCSKRLVEYPMLENSELKIIIRAFKTLVQLLFEKAELSAANEIGNKSFQLLKVINFPKQLVRILFVLTNISFYEEDDRKCLEMISHLQDAYQQSGDAISEALYYTMLAKLLIFKCLIEKRWSTEAREDQIQMCDEYAMRGTVALSCHPKHKSRLFCLCSTMALWCVERSLKDSFAVWYDQALSMQNRVPEINLLTISGTIYLRMTDLRRVKRRFFVFTPVEICTFKNKMKEALEEIHKQVKHFFPILQKDARELEVELHATIKDSKVLKE